MNLINKFISYVKRVCKNDEICVMVVFVLLGFMLCYLFKDEISGFTLQGAPIDFGSESGGNNNVLTNNQPLRSGGGEIGIELNKRVPEPTPSTERQLKVMAGKPPVSGSGVGSQVPGLSVQDSMMFKPFDEVWNPGFMPLDMVFKDVQKLPVPSVASPQAMPGPKPDSKPLVGGSQPSVGDDVAKGDLKVILVYAPWCGHSKKMLPDYEKVKSEFHGKVVNGKQVSIIMYDSDVDKDKVKEYGVKGFPTLFVEKNGVREPFPHRSYDKIAEYIKNA